MSLDRDRLRRVRRSVYWGAGEAAVGLLRVRLVSSRVRGTSALRIPRPWNSRRAEEGLPLSFQSTHRARRQGAPLLTLRVPLLAGWPAASMASRPAWHPASL
jgi:hypothetical protein